MKTKAVLSTIIFLLSVVFANAATKDNAIYNEEFNSTGQKTAVTYFAEDGGNLVPDKKNTFEYTTSGQVAEKVVYKWDESKKIWVEESRTEYTYSADGKLSSIIISEWNSKKKEWKIKNKQDIAQYITISDNDRLLTENK